MKNNFIQKLEELAVPIEELSRDFTDEQKRVAENELRYYDVLVALKKMRKDIGLTQEQLAKKASLPRTTVTKIESGKHNPTLSTLMSLTAAMNKKLQIEFI